jgi:serine O-acetyltransferase
MTSTKDSTKDSIKDITTRIVQSYTDSGGINHVGDVHVPSRNAVERILREIEELCFPGFSRDDCLTPENVEYITGSRVDHVAGALTGQIGLNLRFDADHDKRTVTTTELREEARAQALALLSFIPELRAVLALDVQALHDGDPAVRSREEVILAYPGLRAVLVHRVAHFLWQRGVRLVARMMAEAIHGETGIDIHPGATIGKHFHIDHGTGVVIGETTVIGDHVKIYQGVSLGALSVQKRLQDKKRHPTIEDHVTIYAGATILGGETVVGHHSVVGGNVWLVKSVPPHSVIEREAVVRVNQRNNGNSGFDPSI